jgi:ribonuclease D
LRNAVFGADLPELNLSALASYLLKQPMSKSEQVSVWSSRPLRKTQQAYAAKDSITVALLYEFMVNAVREKCPEKMSVLFEPFLWQKKENSDDQSDPAVKKKTKASHLSEKDLQEIITVNFQIL